MALELVLGRIQPALFQLEAPCMDRITYPGTIMLDAIADALNVRLEHSQLAETSLQTLKTRTGHRLGLADHVELELLSLH